jgi:CRP-like cAMP-binding protein
MPSQFSPEKLRSSEIFRNFTDAEIRQLLAACSDVQFASGAVIYEAGTVHRALYFLTDGNVELGLSAPALTETVVATLSAMAVFGEASFFHNAPHSVTARCRTDATAIRLERTAFDQLIGANSTAALRLGANAADILAARLQQTDQWIAELLQAHQDAKIHESWRRFRERRGPALISATGIHPGAGYTV